MSRYFKTLTLCSLTLLLTASLCRTHALAGWVSLGAISSNARYVSIASDNSRLLVLQDEVPATFGDPHQGYIWEYLNGAWVKDNTSFGQLDRYPDIAVKGSLAGASAINSPSSVKLLYHDGQQWDESISWLRVNPMPRTCIAKSGPYICFVESNTIYVASQIAWFDLPGVQAGVPGGDILGAAIAGDDTYIYTAYTQNTAPNMGDPNYPSSGDWVAVLRDDEQLGDMFGANGYATHPEIDLVQGVPVVAWVEDQPGGEHKKTVYVAKWSGSDWSVTKVAEAATVNHFIESMRVAASGSDFYIAYTESYYAPEITSEAHIIRWDGTDFHHYADPSNFPSTASFPEIDIAVYQGSPAVAFIEGTTIKVMVCETATPPKTLSAVHLLLGD